MDTPGFLDTTLSESRITRMITDKLNALRYANSLPSFRSGFHFNWSTIRLPFLTGSGITQDLWVSVYYFHPITDIRLSGSKRHSIALLKSFAESYIAASINVVTTMWNTLSTPKQLEDATKRYRSLELEVFTVRISRSYSLNSLWSTRSWIPTQKSPSLDVILSKFKFTKKSALSVLDTTWRGWHHSVDKVQDVNRYPHYHALTLSNSLSRITNTQQQLLFLAEDKASTLASGSNLTSKRVLKVLDKKEKATREVLQAFIYDLYEFDQSAYRSAFPDLPFPPVRFQGSSSTHLKTHFKWLVAPVKWALRMEKWLYTYSVALTILLSLYWPLEWLVVRAPFELKCHWVLIPHSNVSHAHCHYIQKSQQRTWSVWLEFPQWHRDTLRRGMARVVDRGRVERKLQHDHWIKPLSVIIWGWQSYYSTTQRKQWYKDW